MQRRWPLAAEASEQIFEDDTVLAARERLVDSLLASAWAGRDGHCLSEIEDAQIDAVAGE
jgi:hypothetical protein